MDEDQAITEHLGCCSPCFVDYQEALTQLRAKRRAAALRATRKRPYLVLYVVAFLCLVAISYVLLGKLSKPASPRTRQGQTKSQAEGSVLFVLDMSQAGRSHGDQRPSQGAAPIRLKRLPMHVSVYLPIGSESGNYEISFLRQKSAVWSTIVSAKRTDQETVAEFDVDLRNVSPGQYILILASHGGTKVSEDIIVEDSEHEN